MEILLRLDLRCKISQGSRKGSPSRVLTPFQVLTKVKGLHPSLRRRKVVFLMMRSILVLNVVENMKASVLLVREISTDVARVVK